MKSERLLRPRLSGDNGSRSTQKDVEQRRRQSRDGHRFDPAQSSVRLLAASSSAPSVDRASPIHGRQRERLLCRRESFRAHAIPGSVRDEQRRVGCGQRSESLDASDARGARRAARQHQRTAVATQSRATE